MASSPHQHTELCRLGSEGHRFVVSYGGDLPISFSTFGIYVVGPTNNTLGAQGDLDSKGEPDALQSARAGVAARHPDKATPASKLVILFHYRDGPARRRRRAFRGPPRRAEPRRVTLREIGKEGSPFSIAAEPEAVVWEWSGQEVTIPLGDKQP